MEFIFVWDLAAVLIIGVPTRRELTVIIILILIIIMIIIIIIIIIISWLGITGISLLTPVYINLIH